ncbi:MAG: TRAP transporter small permease [Robinsoniella sp.]|nr:TRAP transporter small permease [Robinsoniella sp.]
MKALHKIRKGIDMVLSSVCVLLFALMVVVGTYQIVSRYFFNSPSTISEELLTYSFTWMALLASAYVFGKRDHMRMGFLADKLTGTPRKILEIVIECLVMLLAGSVMVYGGYNIMQLTMTQVTASLGIPMGVVYTVVPLSGILIVFYSILNIVDLAVGYEREQREVKE